MRWLIFCIPACGDTVGIGRGVRSPDWQCVGTVVVQLSHMHNELPGYEYFCFFAHWHGCHIAWLARKWYSSSALEERVLYCGIVAWWALVQVSDSLISGREPWLSRRAWQEMASHIPTQYTTKPRHQYTTMSIHQYNATHTRYPGCIAALPHTSQEEATQLLKSNVARGWSINWGGRVLRYNSGGRESQVDRMYYRASLHRCTITPSQYAPGWHHRSIGPNKLGQKNWSWPLSLLTSTYFSKHSKVGQLSTSSSSLSASSS